MTFILGINLTDKIYLAADSLVTKIVDGKPQTAGYCLKLIPMTDKENKHVVAVLFAGNKSFINFIFGKLATALNAGELDSDINNLIGNIDQFLKKIVPDYPGPYKHKRCKMIFAGCSKIPNAVKRFRMDNLSDALGPEAGHIDDAHAVQGIQLGFINAPDQKIFSYEIDADRSIFGPVEVGEMYSVMYGGSKKLEPEQRRLVLKHFLSRREIELEAKDIISFLRQQFSDTIGGAIALAYIDTKRRPIFMSYNIDRSGKLHHTNWSFMPKNDTYVGIDPGGKEHDLAWGFYNLPAASEDNNLEM
jgi:hypothetical protein